MAGPPPLFDRRPDLVAPAGDGRLVALAGTSHGLWRTPADGLEETADMGGVIDDAKRHPYHLGHPFPGPDLAAETLGLGAPVQEGGEAGAWLGSQSPGCPRWRAML